MNNKVIIGVVVLVVIVVGVLFVKGQYGSTQPQGSAPQTQPATQTGSSPAMAANAVTIQNMAFSPATLTVKVGDKVTWTNQDSVGHSATADAASFDTAIIAPGQSGSNIFTKAGTYTYHCSVHPRMKATIVVQ